MTTFISVYSKQARLTNTVRRSQPTQQQRRASSSYSFTVRAAEGDDKKKDEDAADEFSKLKYTKASEFMSLSNEQILNEVSEAKKLLYKLRVKQSTRKAYKGHHFDILRKKVAQLYTVRRQREVTEGVSKRESRESMKQEKKTNLYI
jgi:large subunit ribosomal protein L29